MKFKYYLRGLGIGIIVTTIILTISHSGHKSELTEEEIIQRAEALGMTMKEDSLFPFENKETTEEQDVQTEILTQTEKTELSDGTETESETEFVTETEKESETELVTETSEEVYHLTIFPGATAHSIGKELQKNGLVADGKAFSKYLAEVGYSTVLVVGEYEIPYGIGSEEIYQILKEGPLR